MTMIRKTLILCMFAMLITLNVKSQRRIGVKTNLPHLFTATPNIGVEYAFADNFSFEISGGFNPFVFKNEAQIKHWIIWPEIRYWVWDSFDGHFIGLHGLFGEFNIGGIKLPISGFEALKSRRYKGNAKGGGVSYGYQWIVGSNLLLELTAGVGIARINYDAYILGEDGAKINEGKKNYLGPTKGAVSLIYIF